MYTNGNQSKFKNYFEQAPAVCWLISINVVVFLLSVFVPQIYSVLCLSTFGVKEGMLWSFITYAFLHGDMLHILFNLLGLYFMGFPLERGVGWRRFLIIYFSGVLLGGLVWLCFSWGINSTLVGASAGVMAVLAAFCLFYPPIPLTFLIFFVIPVSVKPLTMLKIVGAIELVGLIFSLNDGGSSIAYSAHLGGLLAGIICTAFIKNNLHVFSINNFFNKIKKIIPKKKNSKTDLKFKINLSVDDTNEIDRILDKVNRLGFSSLTDEERDFLRRANK